MTTERTPALGGDFPQGNEPKASPARDEGERTNEGVVAETGWTVTQTINQLEQEATREGLPASTVHRLKIAATTLAALSPAQTGAPVAWRWRNPGGVWNYQEERQRIASAEHQPLYAAPEER